MRDRFDLILFDTPSLSEAVDAVVLAPFVDGTVVIVDAGATRWQVVRHAVDEIHAQQGRVLGVVLNKRRHYIPEYVYRRL
jgi:Mrp family chromosome partitioning ATPase